MTLWPLRSHFHPQCRLSCNVFLLNSMGSAEISLCSRAAQLLRLFWAYGVLLYRILHRRIVEIGILKGQLHSLTASASKVLPSLYPDQQSLFPLNRATMHIVKEQSIQNHLPDWSCPVCPVILVALLSIWLSSAVCCMILSSRSSRELAPRRCSCLNCWNCLTYFCFRLSSCPSVQSRAL